MATNDSAISWDHGTVKTSHDGGANGIDMVVAQQRLQLSILANRMKILERSADSPIPSGFTSPNGSNSGQLPYRPPILHNQMLQVRRPSSDSTPSNPISGLTASTDSNPLSVPLSMGMNYLATTINTYVVVRPLNTRVPGTLEGMKADVLLVRNTTTARLFVEKRLYTKDFFSREGANAEIRALQQIRDRDCPIYINKLFDIFLSKDEGYCSLILEHCDAGTVQDKLSLLREADTPPVEGYVWHILSALVKAVYFCHTGVDADAPSRAQLKDWIPLCHLDIKPSNVFLSKDSSHGQYPRVVLGDFGSATSSKDITKGRALRDIQERGRPGWFPPECKFDSIRGWDGEFGTWTDIWQMAGVTQVLCRLTREPDMERVDFGRPAGKGYSKELNAFIGWCMDRDAGRRPDARRAVEWVRNQMVKRESMF